MESATVLAQRHDALEVEFITEDTSVGEFLDPATWTMASVRLPYDHISGRKGLLVKDDDEWLALPHMAVDSPASEEAS